MSHPDPTKDCYGVCDTCGKEINDHRDIQYPWGHHGEPVQCTGCYSSASDAIYEDLKGRE